MALFRQIAGVLCLSSLCSLCLCGSISAQAPAVEKIPILLDTDIGNDVDDALALALILASPELELRGITTSGTDPQMRALLLSRFLTMTGRRHIPVAAGSEAAVQRPIAGQYQYYYHPDILFNRTTRPVKESAVDFLYARLKAQPGKVTILATGPLTNIAQLIEQKPDCKPLVKRIVMAGGALQVTDEQKPANDTAFSADPAAAKKVVASGIPLVLVTANHADRLVLDEKALARIFAPRTALSMQVQALYQLTDDAKPRAGDALAVALCMNERFVKLEDCHVAISDEGRVLLAGTFPNARIVTKVQEADFLKWYVDRMASCVAPASRPTSPVAQGGFPNRVHVAEDYDTDIERRWWMAGKAETKNVPPGSRRACRGVLTHDFDDLLGHSRAMYTAVVFNPVPGPPMGKNTRLSFRYWLKGTDTLRVQIYSLTSGYHRHLVLAKLPQGQWQSATVDMTVARRPDGTGGPLSEGERIDDIQFYADPAAALIIDDIVLYDAAVPGEKRPFPKRILFTGWFDSGKQGKEWPGAFEIARQKGYFWHAAKSVMNPETGRPWIRVGLRGERPVGDAIRLTFRYRLTGTDAMKVELTGVGLMKGVGLLGEGTARTTLTVELKGLAQDRWAEATVNFGDSRLVDRVNGIRWQLPAGAELLIDDVLLYERGG